MTITSPEISVPEAPQAKRVNKRVAARYQRDGLAAAAMRRALRQKIAVNKFTKRPKDLNDRQRGIMRDAVQNRMQKYRQTNPALNTLNPMLQKLFLKQRHDLRHGGWDKIQAKRQEQSGGNPAGPGAPGLGSQPDPVAPPHVKINPNGMLDLPYNMAYSQGMMNQTEKANQQLLGLQQQDQEQNQEYAQSKRDAELDYQKLATQTLNNFASRGLGFSTAYGNANAENNNNYNNFLGDLEQWNTTFDQGIAGQRGAIENSINNWLRNEALNQAAGLEGKAGSLGYGQSRPNTSYNTPKVKPPKKSGKSGGNKHHGRSKKRKRR